MCQEEYDPADALKEISSLCDRIDEDVPDYAWDKAPEFFESIKEQATDMSETIEKSDRVTEAQMSAIRNWREGVDKWIKD